MNIIRNRFIPENHDTHMLHETLPYSHPSHWRRWSGSRVRCRALRLKCARGQLTKPGLYIYFFKCIYIYNENIINVHFFIFIHISPYIYIYMYVFFCNEPEKITLQNIRKAYCACASATSNSKASDDVQRSSNIKA